jgi:hypothetical protein
MMTEVLNLDVSVVPATSPIDRLRVLSIGHAYVVGVNQGKLDAIDRVEGVEVGLLAPSNWKAMEWNRWLPLERPYPNLQIYSAPVMLTGVIGGHFYAPWILWQVVRDFQPDLIHVEAEVFSLCAFEVAILARLTGKPLVVFGWEINYVNCHQSGGRFVNLSSKLLVRLLLAIKMEPKSCTSGTIRDYSK